ncbi:SIR2 family NAD-dependent protein deacylase [Cellulomonas oligotrophica]|uniref:protein acetyllysine N-acetyltransferase n=1 Tax=Cellulomonas oligotrophica TaxID=931536 RepID=A0A7Y9FFF7_9CELL|nr:Sir2 family NAD-dependent protein deacetylase [Cellulomonas oligotrophica]NYD86017.1 NAD-dependent deacetylase [Cellulomonas oligotrophica]GIG30975.1 NAD-dependent protein deacetylase 2 [Cellulomonas oligotrophica]
MTPSVTVLTGAGISTDVGIPDFRGPQGTWTLHPERQDLLDYPVYMADPDVRRRSWLARLHSPMWDAHPSDAHRALVELEKAGVLTALLTQNIDGLHQAAGSSSELVVELHGSLFTTVCTACDGVWATQAVLERLVEDPDPHCERCGGILKTSTVMFGQDLPRDALDRAAEAASTCDVMVAVGTSLQVHPVAGLVPLAAHHGAEVVIVNAEPTPYDDVAVRLVREPIQTSLPALVRELVDR